MSFANDMDRAVANTKARLKALHLGVATEVQRSIQEGSEITGAPGQPVDTGNLRASWQLTFPGEWVAESSTGVEYAPPIEHGVGPYGPLTLRSQVGGFHSVALTAAGADRIVDVVAARIPK